MTAEQFKASRLAKKMTQRELATYLGASYSAVTKWEVGRNPIPKWVQDKMAVRKSITVDTLSASEIAKLEKKAAEKGWTADGITAELIRNFIKLSSMSFWMPMPLMFNAPVPRSSPRVAVRKRIA